jgi:hypothetical protein
MVMAAVLSEKLGLVDAAFVQRLTRLIERAGLPTRAPALPLAGSADVAARYLQLMRVDKKAEAGELAGLLVEIALGAYGDYHEAPMKAAAGLVGVDLAAIAKATRAELVAAAAPKGKKATAKKTAAKKTARKRQPAPPPGVNRKPRKAKAAKVT